MKLKEDGRGVHVDLPISWSSWRLKKWKKKFSKKSVNRLYLLNQKRYMHQIWTDWPLARCQGVVKIWAEKNKVTPMRLSIRA